MILTWMSYATLAAAALGAAGWLVDYAVAGRSVRRRALWAAIFFASAVGPVAFSLTRGVPAAVVAPENGAAPAASAIVSDRVVGSAWLTASAVLALWLVATHLRLRRRRHVYQSLIVDGERVLISIDFGPAVIGILGPRIVLPEWVLAMGESERRIIVAHESEHRDARDPLLTAMALIVAVAFPWNVALWWQLGRLRLAIEIDCDQRVVSRHGQDPHMYGMVLLATRQRASRITPALAMPMAAMRSGLGRRVEALVGGRPRSGMHRLGAMAAASVFTAAVISISAPPLSMAHAAMGNASSPLTSGSDGAIVSIQGSSIRVLLPRRDGDSSEARWIGRSDSRNRRILQSRTAPNRWIQIPARSRRPSPR